MSFYRDALRYFKLSKTHQPCPRCQGFKLRLLIYNDENASHPFSINVQCDGGCTLDRKTKYEVTKEIYEQADLQLDPERATESTDPLSWRWQRQKAPHTHVCKIIAKDGSATFYATLQWHNGRWLWMTFDELQNRLHKQIQTSRHRRAHRVETEILRTIRTTLKANQTTPKSFGNYIRN